MSKYKNIKIMSKKFGLFDSKAEFERGLLLAQLEKTGEIRDLKRQVEFELQESFKINKKTVRAIKYICDFYYIDKNGSIIVEDVKSSYTKKDPIYSIKKKMFMKKYCLDKNVKFLEIVV